MRRMPPQPVAFVLNARAGGRRDGSAFDPYRAQIDALAQGGPVTLVDQGADICEVVQAALAKGCRAVVAGGGDGTLSAVASCLVGGSAVLGVLPFGTFNHFAKDAGIPLDAAAALATTRAGHVAQVDVGEIAGRHFLNNASLGLYAQVVHHRERQQAQLGRGKWRSLAWAAWSAMRRYPFMTLQLDVTGRPAKVRTPFLFIGNNRYEMSGLHIGERRSLREGVLSVHLAHRAGRMRLVALALLALAGRLGAPHGVQSLVARELHIESEHATLHVATDGEVARMPTPLHCRIHPGALRVFVPEST
jgi:diacylglycerol kinase family enzyme